MRYLKFRVQKRPFLRSRVIFVALLLFTLVTYTMTEQGHIAKANGYCNGGSNPCSIPGGDYNNINFWGRWVIDSGNGKSATTANGTYFAFSFTGANQVTINVLNSNPYSQIRFGYKVLSNGTDSVGCQSTSPCQLYTGYAGQPISKPNGAWVTTNTYTVLIYPDPITGLGDEPPYGSRTCGSVGGNDQWYHRWFDTDTVSGNVWTLSSITLQGSGAPQLQSGFITNPALDNYHIAFPNISMEFIGDSLADGNPTYATETGYSLYGYNGVYEGFSSFGLGTRGVSWNTGTQYYPNNPNFPQPIDPNNTSQTDDPNTYNNQFYCGIPPAVSNDIVSGSRYNYNGNGTIINNLGLLNQRKPNVVVIELGDNDYIYGVAAYPNDLTDLNSQSYRNDLIKFISTVYNQYGQPQIYVIEPLPCNSTYLPFNGLCDNSRTQAVYDDTGLNPLRTYHNAAGDAVNNARINFSTNKIHVLDLNQAINTNTDLSDGVHLNPTGTVHVAHALTVCIGQDFSNGGDNGTAQYYTWQSASNTCAVH